MPDFEMVVIGSGPAGEKAAAQAAYFGHRVAIVERESEPGGDAESAAHDDAIGPVGTNS